MTPLPLPDLNKLSHAEKNALIIALLGAGRGLDGTGGDAGSEAERAAEDIGQFERAAVQGPKAARPEEPKREGPRRGSLGRKGGGRLLSQDPDQIVSAKATSCQRCHAALGEDDQHLHNRYDKIDLPPVRPVVTRVERYVDRCSCCGGTTLAPVPDGMEEGTPFGPSIVAAALYLRFTHAISYQRLRRLFEHLFGLNLSEGALDAMFRRAKPAFDDAVVAILG